MNKKKLSALLLAGTLTAGVVGGTFAWFTSQDTVTNQFTTGKTDNDDPDAGIKIVEKFNEPDKVLPGDETNKDVQVKNTANYDQFIRVKFEKKFVKVDENGEKTEIKTDSTGKPLDTSLIELNFTTHFNKNGENKEAGQWVKSTETDEKGNKVDYYYYIGKVAGDSHTNTLLDSVTLSSKAGNEYKNLDFDVTVVADSIQASNDAYVSWCKSSGLVDTYKNLQTGEATTPKDDLIKNNDKSDK